jgi:regulatory protein YycI of two-component signal transduction system YycFG
LTNKTFVVVCFLLLCIFLAGILVGATIGTKAQKEIDRVKIEAMTEQNLRVLERVENLQLALDHALGLRKPMKDILIARPGEGD